jgi:hypothetical protein
LRILHAGFTSHGKPLQTPMAGQLASPAHFADQKLCRKDSVVPVVETALTVTWLAQITSVHLGPHHAQASLVFHPLFVSETTQYLGRSLSDEPQAARSRSSL